MITRLAHELESLPEWEKGDLNGKNKWGLTGLFCPYCGVQDMWQMVGDRNGDFYLGIETYCNTCRSQIFSLNYSLVDNDNGQ